MFAQSSGVGETNVVDPALHAGVKLGKADQAFLPFPITLAQPARGLNHLAALDTAMHRKDDQAESPPLLNEGQYEHVSRQIAELGRLLGSWMKQEGNRCYLPDARREDQGNRMNPIQDPGVQPGRNRTWRRSGAES